MMNYGPAVVFAALDDVHFVAAARTVEAARAVFRFPKQIRAGLKIDALRIATAVHPNLGPRILLTDKWIVLRHGSIIIQPQNFSGKRIQLLRQFTISCIARGDVKLSVRPKSQTTPGMELRSGNTLDDDFAIDEAGGRLAIANYAHQSSV